MSPKENLNLNPSGDELFYSSWGGRCIASRVNGVFILITVLDPIPATDAITWECTSAPDETKKLFSGSTDGIEWDNGEYLTMTGTDNNNLKVTYEQDI